MKELSMWTDVLDKTRCTRLKARWRFFRGKFLLSKKELLSSFRESAAVHYVQSDLASFSDGAGRSDDDPAVVRTVENLSVIGSDDPISIQEKEVRSLGGIPSR
ncbi:MAG: hypothetical protein PVJ05_00165 [Candidatus Thorarchaeota archaeon]|jgi:hypothetical protein